MAENGKNEFEKELVKLYQRSRTIFGYERKIVKEEDGQGFFLYRLITHSGVAHTNWVNKEALRNYINQRAVR